MLTLCDVHGGDTGKVKCFQGHLSCRFANGRGTNSSDTSARFHSRFEILQRAAEDEPLDLTICYTVCLIGCSLRRREWINTIIQDQNYYFMILIIWLIMNHYDSWNNLTLALNFCQCRWTSSAILVPNFIISSDRKCWNPVSNPGSVDANRLSTFAAFTDRLILSMIPSRDKDGSLCVPNRQIVSVQIRLKSTGRESPSISLEIVLYRISDSVQSM